MATTPDKPRRAVSKSGVPARLAPVAPLVANPAELDHPSGELTIRQYRKLLGERLVVANLVSSDQLDLALSEQQRAGGKLGEVLERLGFVSHNILSSVLAQDAGSDMVDLENAIVYPEALELIPYQEAVKYKVLPLAVEESVLLIAMANTYDVVAIDAIQRLTNRDVEVVAATPRELTEAIERAYNTTSSIEETIDQLLGAKRNVMLEESSYGEAPMVRLADQILMLAVRERATDIHLEPDELVVRIRLRVDGTVRQATVIPNGLKLGLTAVFKIKCGMDITERRRAQDGRMGFQLAQRRIDVRASSLPTIHGENLVLRLLDKGAMALNLDTLQLSRRDRRIIEQTMASSYGMMLVAGPTGAGKTTTLYSALGCVNALERSVFTLEDPVEYELPIIRQTQINEEVGLGFANGLRTLLRQDPDVIMVGEMRDKETAQLAVRAALTGHLVLSTIHANTAVAVIPRLVDMGVEPYLVAASQPVIVGQRLGRKLCESCAEVEPDPQKILEEFNLPVPANDNFQLYKAVGCVRCGGTGYRGRTAFYEVVKVDSAFHEAILNNDVPELERLARVSSYRTMKEDGLRKAMAGLTTITELMRVVANV